MRQIWNWFMGKASIRKKLIISYVLLVMMPIVILGSYSFSQASENLMKQTEITMNNNLQSMVSEMVSRLEREQDFTRYLAYNLEFRETLEDNAYDSSAIAQSLNKTVEPVFWYFIASDENIKEINIITPYATDNIGAFLKAAEEYEALPWYEEHRKSFHTRWSVEDGKLFATRTILDTATSSRMIGILRTEFYMHRMMTPFEGMDYLDNGILVLDPEGQIVYTKEMADMVLQEEIEQAIRDGKVTQNRNTSEYILKKAYIEHVQWDLYYFIEKGIILDGIRPIIWSTLLVMVGCIMLITVFVGLISTAISRRIMRLKGQAERIAGGDLTNPVWTTDTDEVGIVTNSIGKMTVQLDEMINRVYKIEIEKKASQLTALQAQINPHFLYNCLSSIKWKALRKGEDDIADIAGLIALFYRTSLNNGEPITTVKNELENVKSYVEIQRRMHDESFRVDYRLSEEGQESQMPNFLLQPIVENAVKHGIDCIEDGTEGKLIIEFGKEEEFLVFNIYNNGPLIQSKEIEKLTEKVESGYGIRNIMERILLYYGEDCGISVKTTEDGYTCFTVRIYEEIIEEIHKKRK